MEAIFGGVVLLTVLYLRKRAKGLASTAYIGDGPSCREITRQEFEYYWEHGFVFVHQMFSAEEIAVLRRTIEADRRVM
jgi:hypothetical protein